MQNNIIMISIQKNATTKIVTLASKKIRNDSKAKVNKLSKIILRTPL